MRDRRDQRAGPIAAIRGLLARRREGAARPRGWRWDETFDGPERRRPRLRCTI